MLVQELIAFLKQFPPDMLVVVALRKEGGYASPLSNLDRGKYITLSPTEGSLFRLNDPGPFGPSVEEVVILRPRT